MPPSSFIVPTFKCGALPRPQVHREIRPWIATHSNGCRVLNCFKLATKGILMKVLQYCICLRSMHHIPDTVQINLHMYMQDPVQNCGNVQRGQRRHPHRHANTWVLWSKARYGSFGLRFKDVSSRKRDECMREKTRSSKTQPTTKIRLRPWTPGWNLEPMSTKPNLWVKWACYHVESPNWRQLLSGDLLTIENAHGAQHPSISHTTSRKSLVLGRQASHTCAQTWRSSPCCVLLVPEVCCSESAMDLHISGNRSASPLRVSYSPMHVRSVSSKFSYSRFKLPRNGRTQYDTLIGNSMHLPPILPTLFLFRAHDIEMQWLLISLITRIRDNVVPSSTKRQVAIDNLRYVDLDKDHISTIGLGWPFPRKKPCLATVHLGPLEGLGVQRNTVKIQKFQNLSTILIARCI